MSSVDKETLIQVMIDSGDYTRETAIETIAKWESAPKKDTFTARVNYTIWLESKGRYSGDRSLNFEAPADKLQYDPIVWRLATLAIQGEEDCKEESIHINEVEALD